jgi:FkbM family methyltransferase
MTRPAAGARSRSTQQAFDPTRSPGADEPDRRLLEHVRGGRGTFVELGAFDGLSQSNTAWLEAHRGWRGVLVEAIPEAYERCVLNRPHATVVNCACVSDEYSHRTIEMVFAGLMSIVRGARSSPEADDAWVAIGEELQQLERYACDVPARTLTSVLDDCRLYCVDLLSLDVEGYELEVLKGLDFERLGPRHVLVEESGTADAGRFLAGRGYRRIDELGHGRLTRDVLFERPLGRARTATARSESLARRRYLARADRVSRSRRFGEAAATSAAPTPSETAAG